MDVLVLGGSVFVGKHLVDLLVARGDRVSVLNRGVTPSALPEGVEHVLIPRAHDIGGFEVRRALPPAAELVGRVAVVERDAGEGRQLPPQARDLVLEQEFPSL